MRIQAEVPDMTLPEAKTTKKSRPQKYWRTQATAYLFVLPALLIFALFTFNPIITTIIYSFQKVNLAKPPEWVGLHNYERMFGNPLFLKAWSNSFAFLGLSIALGFLVPIVLALIINELRRLKPVFQTVVYLPSLIPIAVALLVWRQIYAPDNGILNSMLKSMGLQGQLWLQNPDLVKPAMVVIMTWLGAGASVLIYLSALQEIPNEIYEAAEIDGFSPMRRVWFITLPLLKSRMLIMLVLQIIAIMQVFTEPYILTSGGPANASVTPVLEIYRTAFERSDFGLASAWSVSLLVVLSAFSIWYVWLTQRRDKREA